MSDALRLAGADWEALLLPRQGAALARLTHRGIDLLAPLPEGADPNATRAGAFWMIPWGNRLDGGALGALHRFPVNRPAENTAIHGLSRDLPWQTQVTADGALLTQLVAVGPYAYAARIALSLSAAGFGIEAVVENSGAAPMPFGLGWHPWFARRPGQRLRVAARHRLLSDERLLPREALPDPGLDAACATLIGTDAHFAGWDGLALLEDPVLRLTLRASGAWATNLQVFLPAEAEAVCIEPMSHIPDAPNQPVLARLGALAMLAPGAALAAAARLEIG
ncbi:aldose epimerase family protein [Plastoroseomonas hellenica]|uniref:Aldose epimerase n=1 Tax=Plastoroseomonas hellenica TaxID=2687306 RepID=A0ABS5F8E6_9PROT|nr:aldose epimerase [Plastoroseomonas hellenica]MBR0646692.1 aldose epimerase [Plastoroseomonas hellenica]MBR0668723.1 aldose epimerase [Plastoroseomonas hellenica]